MFVFNLFVDVISADERTKEESIFVVKLGDTAIRLIEIGKNSQKIGLMKTLPFITEDSLGGFANIPLLIDLKW